METVFASIDQQNIAVVKISPETSAGMCPGSASKDLEIEMGQAGICHYTTHSVSDPVT